MRVPVRGSKWCFRRTQLEPAARAGVPLHYPGRSSFGMSRLRVRCPAQVTVLRAGRENLWCRHGSSLQKEEALRDSTASPWRGTSCTAPLRGAVDSSIKPDACAYRC